MQSLGPVPMTQCFQQPRAFCQTHLLALLCLCYYLLFEPLIILANSGKVPQDAACWEDTTKLSTISSSSDPDLSPPPLPACTQRHHDQEPRNPRFLVYNRATAYKLFVRAALFCACSWFGIDTTNLSYSILPQSIVFPSTNYVMNVTQFLILPQTI